jgi:ferrous iron transport protein A
MDAVAAPGGVVLDPGYISLSALSPGATGIIVGMGSHSATLSALDRRLLELGFCSGERVEIVAEARPGRDPFVVRVGHTTLALRRREAENIRVEISRAGTASLDHPQTPAALPTCSRKA